MGSNESSAATPSQRFTKGGAECRQTHVKGYTGPICSCPPLQCGASLSESENQRFNPALPSATASRKDEMDERLHELMEGHAQIARGRHLYQVWADFVGRRLRRG